MAPKFGLIALLALLAAAPPPVPAGIQAAQDDDDPEWPHEILTESHKIVLYQPQLDSLEGDTIVGRSRLCEDNVHWKDDLAITYRRRR